MLKPTSKSIVRMVPCNKPKTGFDLAVERASQIPGPGDYGRPNMSKIGGGKFNESCANSDLEWQIHRAKQIPGPGDYSTNGRTFSRGGAT